MTYVEYSNYKSFLGRVIVNRTLAADLKLQLESLIATQKSNYLSEYSLQLEKLIQQHGTLKRKLKHQKPGS